VRTWVHNETLHFIYLFLYLSFATVVLDGRRTKVGEDVIRGNFGFGVFFCYSNHAIFFFLFFIIKYEFNWMKELMFS
jgi:hypothetical protein